MSDKSVALTQASFALAPDVGKYSCGSEAYDAPARRRDVLAALEILHKEQPPFRWREIFPTYSQDGRERLDAGALPRFCFDRMLALAGIAGAIAFAVILWRFALR